MYGPDVSRGGVQRDLLPIVEGCTVHTSYGMVQTDHVLFIAAGAFNVSKPSDLIPELQGRFPIRVELTALTTGGPHPHPARAAQRADQAVQRPARHRRRRGHLHRRGVESIAGFAEEINRRTQSTGARRLHTIMEKLLEEVSFEAPDSAGSLTVDAGLRGAKLGPSSRTKT